MDQEFHRLQAALPKRYTLLEELDRGGMSRVYHAREELPDRDVAIKVLDEELSARLGRERFVREVEVTSKLVHPHIVPVYSAGDAGGTLYYVMPYIDGESLRDRLEREGRLPIEEALEITREVADALQHAHDRGIVHRDIKPANILFQGGHAVVADFGIARALRAAESGGEFTQSGLPLGTPDYMSPEQAGAEGPVDGRTDTYALACVVYEMLAGDPPFHSRTSQATLARHLTDRMPPLSSVRSSVPPGVEAVIAQALSKAPADRQREVSDLADALLAANGPSTDAKGPRSSRSTLTPLGISLRLAGILLAVAALGLAVQTWSSGGRSLLGGERWETSMSVVPFENRTGDPELEYLGMSLADEIINHLQSAATSVRVIDIYTANSLWKEDLGTPALMDSLDLEHLVHGYYDMRDGQIVVWVRESDPAGSQLQLRDAHPLDPNDLNAGQSELARTVARAFLREVGISENVVLEGSGIGPGRDAYLTGNELLGQRTAQAMRDAIASFTESIELEPANAPAYAGLSSAYALSLFYKYDVGMPSYELAARSLAAADSAIALDPDFANGYSARGYARALLGIEIDGAEADFQRAEQLQPNAPNAPSWNSRVLAGKGQFDEALAEAQRAKDLDPLQAGRRTAIAALALQLGDYELAVAEAREAYRLEERLDVARAFEGRALALLGRGAECLEIDFGVYEMVRALCLHSLGRRQEARELAMAAGRALTTTGIDDPEHLDEVVAQDLASYYGFIGDAGNATRWLRYAFDLSPAGVEVRILESALFDPVRDDPDFGAAVIEVKADARLRVGRERARLES